MDALKCAVTGVTIPKQSIYPIAAATEIHKGQPVVLTAGLIVAVAADATAAIIGVAASEHKGDTSSIYPADYAEEILVYDNPAQIFECNVPVITATGGSTTTIVDTALDAFADDAFNNGYAKLVEKAAASTNTDPIGKIYKISDYTALDNTLTIPTAGGAVTAGDKFEIYPPYAFATFGFDTAFQNIVLTDDDTTCMKVVGHDFKRRKINLMAVLHLLGNKYA